MSKLILTDLDLHQVENNTKFIILGAWCKKTIETTHKKKINYETLEDPFKNFKKKKKDYFICNKVYEQLLDKLTFFFNTFHNLSKKKDYWRIIIGPTILTLVQALWYRWEILKIGMNKSQKFLEQTKLVFNSKQITPINHLNLNQLLYEDHFNHKIFQDMIEFAYINKIKYIKKKKIKYNFQNKTYNQKKKISYFFDKLSNNIFKNKYLIKDIYISKINMLKLNVKIGQFPNFANHISEFNLNELPEIRIIDRKRKKIINYNEKNFIGFLYNYILEYIPMSYIENFSFYRKKALNIKNKSKFFITTTLLTKDFSKFYCAENLNNLKIIIPNHGNAILSEIDSIFNHEDKISFKRLVWHKPILKNHIQIPIHTSQRYLKKNNFNNILIILDEKSYYNNRFFFEPQPIELLNNINNFINELQNLKKEYLKKIILRPYPTILQNSVNIKKQFTDRIKGIQTSRNKSILKDIQKSNLIICTYPQTAYLYSLNSETPTLLLLSKQYKTHRVFNNLVRTMKKNKLIFTCSKKMISFINSNYNNINKWWNLAKIQKTRNLFCQNCGSLSQDSIDNLSKKLLNLN